MNECRTLTSNIAGSNSIIEGTKKSLERLQLDYVDVIFAHRPDHTGTSWLPYQWKPFLMVSGTLSHSADGGDSSRLQFRD